MQIGLRILRNKKWLKSWAMIGSKELFPGLGTTQVYEWHGKAVGEYAAYHCMLNIDSKDGSKKPFKNRLSPNKISSWSEHDVFQD